MSTLHDELLLDSIDNYNIEGAAYSSNNANNLQKQLINYKLQQKILSDLLRQVLSGDPNEYKNDFNPILLHPLVNQLIDLLEGLVGNNKSKVMKYNNEEEKLTIEDQLFKIRQEPSLLAKFQEVIRFFGVLANELNSNFGNLKKLLFIQSEKIGYLQYLMTNHIKESGHIIQAIGSQRQISKDIKSEAAATENDYLIKISNLNSQTNYLNDTILKKDQELQSLRDEVGSLRKLTKVRDELNDRKFKELEDKYQEELDEKDQIIEELRAQLAGARNVTTTSAISSSNSLASEALKIRQLNRNLEELSNKNFQNIIGEDAKQINIYSNFTEENLIENNLVETIGILNSKLIEKNAMLEKINATIQQINKDHNELLNDRLSLKKKLMSQQSHMNALSERFETLEGDIQNCIFNFHSLLSLNIDTYRFFSDALFNTIDRESIEQVRTKIQKLDKLNGKNLNFEKILYYAQAVHRYFETAVESVVSDHRNYIADAEEKQRKDTGQIKELQVGNDKLKRMLIMMKAESGQTNELYEKMEHLMIENDELRQLTKSQQRAMMSTADGPADGMHGSSGNLNEVDMKVEELQKRFKAERERRVLEHRSAQLSIQELMDENKELKNSLSESRLMLME
ncbi:hypothetical protein DASC09_002260 [Saccharomycopsis crataegensis]|uniref:Mto1-like Mto2p-binding domain-containing protein n=1 Tax=Saccharomycopsis crataegensis TaxID=43959 RepID=A0AAV5QDS9_9ASCO|nr:hypothetical protein DASC09_002260 [Saccharomycopsis crataegensis]